MLIMVQDVHTLHTLTHIPLPDSLSQLLAISNAHTIALHNFVIDV